MRGFEKIAREYDRGRRGEAVGFWAEETARLAHLYGGSLVLDLGCGTGIYALGIVRGTSVSMCGLDPTADMLAQARAKSNAVSWLNAVGERIPIRSGVLDCIFSSQVWHHIADREGTAEECLRALRPGGALVIRTISHEQLRRKAVFTYFPEILPHQLEVYPSMEDFDRYFGDAGFASIEHLSYALERYQLPSELIEVAERRLSSMFRPITPEDLERGVSELRRYEAEHPERPIRNDETITLVVACKHKETMSICRYGRPQLPAIPGRAAPVEAVGRDGIDQDMIRGS